MTKLKLTWFSGGCLLKNAKLPCDDQYEGKGIIIKTQSTSDIHLRMPKEIVIELREKDYSLAVERTKKYQKENYDRGV